MLEICDEPRECTRLSRDKSPFLPCLGWLSECLSVLDVRVKGGGFQSTGDTCSAGKGWMIPYG